MRTYFLCQLLVFAHLLWLAKLLYSLLRRVVAALHHLALLLVQVLSSVQSLVLPGNVGGLWAGFHLAHGLVVAEALAPRSLATLIVVHHLTALLFHNSAVIYFDVLAQLLSAHVALGLVHVFTHSLIVGVALLSTRTAAVGRHAAAGVHQATARLRRWLTGQIFLQLAVSIRAWDSLCGWF